MELTDNDPSCMHGQRATEGSTEACATCQVRPFCLPAGLVAADVTRVARLVDRRIKIARGQPLYRKGDRFENLYAVRAGFFKTRLRASTGGEHVTAFPMAGDLLGLDGIASNSCASDALALEDSEVCVIPYEALAQLCRDVPPLQERLHRLLSTEIVRALNTSQLLGGLRAEQRLAAFLLDLAGRLERRGYSANTFVLRMSREEIGTFLGVTLETVSRTFSRFHEAGLLDVHQRAVRILAPAGLRALLAGTPAARIQGQLEGR